MYSRILTTESAGGVLFYAEAWQAALPQPFYGGGGSGLHASGTAGGMK